MNDKDTKCVMCMIDSDQSDHRGLTIVGGTLLCFTHLKLIYEEGKKIDDFFN